MLSFEPAFPGYAQKVARSFGNQSMMTTFGAALDGLEPGYCTISAPILSGSRQQAGYGHAGLTFAIGDSAAGYSALSLLDEDLEVLTTEMKINLLAPAKGNLLIARGRVIRPGRRLIVVTSEVFALENGIETLIALMQGTMMPVRA